jgi:ubiquitin-like protein Pup
MSRLIVIAMQCVRVGSRRAGEDSVDIAVAPQSTEVGMATKDTGGQRQAPRRAEDEQDTDVNETDEVRERQDKLTDDVDAILDEIDEVLEENAEEFVRSYVQKGGE